MSVQIACKAADGRCPASDSQHPDGCEVEAEMSPGLAANRLPFHVPQVRIPSDSQPTAVALPREFSELMEKYPPGEPDRRGVRPDLC